VKGVTLTLSHPIKEMRERITVRQWKGTTLLGVGWSFPHCHGADGSSWVNRMGFEGKRPESLQALRCESTMLATQSNHARPCVSDDRNRHGHDHGRHGGHTGLERGRIRVGNSNIYGLVKR
jgi:hypothetical protein